MLTRVPNRRRFHELAARTAAAAGPDGCDEFAVLLPQTTVDAEPAAGAVRGLNLRRR